LLAVADAVDLILGYADVEQRAIAERGQCLREPARFRSTAAAREKLVESVDKPDSRGAEGVGKAHRVCWGSVMHVGKSSRLLAAGGRRPEPAERWRTAASNRRRPSSVAQTTCAAGIGFAQTQ
jgi:hypothetical protein